jgi:hypothetical protein
LDGEKNPAVVVTLHVADGALAENVNQQNVDQPGWVLASETTGSFDSSIFTQMDAAENSQSLDLSTGKIFMSKD